MGIFLSAAYGLVVAFAYRYAPWWIRCLTAVVAGVLIGIVTKSM